MTAQEQNLDSEWHGWEQLSPVLRHANFFDAPPGGGFGPRYLQDFQILVMQAGRGTMTIDHVEYEISPGDVVFYGPNVQHQALSSVSDPLRLAGIHFVMRAGRRAGTLAAVPVRARDSHRNGHRNFASAAPTRAQNIRRIAQRDSPLNRGLDSQFLHRPARAQARKARTHPATSASVARRVEEAACGS
jgi:ectoine hydroxylase-related dioxygenase (phytanoyl-CoA dioxygenase family)